MTPWIQNVSLDDIKRGLHPDPGVNTVLIQIVDPGLEFPTSKYQFRSVHRYHFLDAEETDPYPDEWKCSFDQARSIVEVLKTALANNSNVLVHCVAGVCRSGAVVEVGVIMGFRDTEVYRQPHLS